LGDVKMKLQMVFVAAMLSCAVAFAQQIMDFAPNIQVFDPLTDSHLIVRAHVGDIHMETRTVGGYLVEGQDDSQLRVFKVSVEVDELLRGNDPGPRMTFDVLRDASMFRKGEEYIICGYWREARGVGSYLAGPIHGLYVRSGKDSWQELPGSGQGVTMSDRSLRARVATAEMPKVTDGSDVVALGRITATWTAKYSAPFGREGAMQRYRLLVTEAFKGVAVADTVEFVIPVVSVSYMPPWTKHTPRPIEVGEEWLVLLRQGDEGLYPFAGPNSLLKVVGSDLVYDCSVPYPHSKNEVTSAIRAEASHVQN
jgi:hypothetical protein